MDGKVQVQSVDREASDDPPDQDDHNVLNDEQKNQGNHEVTAIYRNFNSFVSLLFVVFNSFV